MRRTSRLVGLAREALTGGDLARAAELVASAGDDATMHERAELLRIRAQLALAGALAGPADTAQLAADAEELADEEPLLAGLTLVDAAVIALYRNEPHEAMRHVARARELIGDDAGGRRYAAIVTGAAHTFLGEMEAASEVLEEAIQPFSDAGSLLETGQALQIVVVAFATLERYDAAASIAQRAVAAARRVGAVGLLPMLLCLLANSLYFTGDYDTMLFAAGDAIELSAATNQPAMMVFASACLALAHAVRGQAAEVERHVATVRRLVPTAGLDVFLNTVLVAEGLLALGSADWPRAAEIYDELDRCLAASGRRTGALQWSADHIEALYRVGRIDDAHRALAETEEAIRSLDLGWSRAVAARCRGMLADDGWRDHLAAAVAAHRSVLTPFELGRTHLVWAERALADGRVDEAHEHAEQARDCFRAVAAPAWTARAEALRVAEDVRAVEEALAAEPEPEPADAGSGPVEVRAFGPLTIVRDNVEQIVAMDAPGKLMRFLVAEGGRVATEHAAEVLWPDLPPGTGTTRLRKLLSRMRRQWGDVIVREGAVLRWDDHVVVDAKLFESEAAHALRGDGDASLARRAVDRYRGELIPMARLDDWALVPRERARRTYLRLLRFLADNEAAAGEVDTAVHRLEIAADTDRYDDSHYLRAAEILLDAGRPGAARRFLDRADAICRELGVAPSDDLHRLRLAVLKYG